MVDAVRALSRASAVDKIMSVVRESARDLTGADGVTFVQRQGDHVYYADEDAIAPLWKGRRFRAAECVSGWAMTHREVVVIDDVFGDSRVPRAKYEPTFVKSMAMVPIRIDNPTAAIGVYWGEKSKPSQDHIEVLQVLADATAMALDRVRLDNTLRSQEEMLRVVAHDMRNPLNTISMAATLLGYTTEESSLGELARKHAATIRRASARVDRLITDLADSAAIEAGVFSIRAGHCTASIVLDHVRDLEGLALEHHHVLTVEPPPHDATMSCGPDRLVQAIGNLVRNAITHTPKGTHVRVGADIHPEVVCFFVDDDGPGIPSDVAATLFQRYARRGSATHGTGLGLFIVKGIVEAHGGTITVDSAPQAGTTFSFTVPAPAAPETLAGTPDETQVRGSPPA